MALAAIQASYDDDDDESIPDEISSKKNNEQWVEDQMAVINDPAFSVMSKIKLNLTPAIAIQVSERELSLRFILSFVFSQRIPAVFSM